MYSINCRSKFETNWTSFGNFHFLIKIPPPPQQNNFRLHNLKMYLHPHPDQNKNADEIQFVPNVWDGKEAGKNHPKKVWPLFYYLIALVCQGLFLLSGLIMSFFFPLRLDSVTSVWALKFLNVRDKHVALESSSWGLEAALVFCVTFSTAITLNFLKPLSHLKLGLLLLSLTELSRWPMLTTTHLQTSKRYHVREKRNVLEILVRKSKKFLRFQGRLRGFLLGFTKVTHRAF